ncbi:M20 family metallopeptidase [Nakamurella lactea]|uniref:M20 family metallopeptidase n=1 Tax=Nakamurella lactea TaxID=459515 RepID=UPI00055DB605
MHDLERLVTCESPTADLAAVAAGANLVDVMGAGYLGSAAERIVVDGRTHLRWRLGGDTGPRVLIVCHQDTVWPIGTLQRLPFRVEDGIVYGPGCFDMKTGLAMAFHALRLLGAPQTLPSVTLLVTGDEEIGSPTSRQLIEDEARQSSAAFVLEASGNGGALKTGRKGVSLFRVSAFGRASHAGLEPEKGLNAAVEIAGQVLAINGLGDPAAGTSVVPSVLSAGTTSNTVPAAATLMVDSRAWTVAEQQRVQAAMTSLQPTVPGARVEVTGGINRPPMEPAGSQTLFALAEELSSQIGSGALQQISVGGGSDGNFTAGVGCPTLDGMGAVGGGAHADSEHVIVEEIPRRTALLAGLIDAVCSGAAVR